MYRLFFGTDTDRFLREKRVASLRSARDFAFTLSTSNPSCGYSCRLLSLAQSDWPLFEGKCILNLGNTVN